MPAKQSNYITQKPNMMTQTKIDAAFGVEKDCDSLSLVVPVLYPAPK